MHDSKLLELIKNLEAKEFKQLSKFIRFTNKNDNQTIVLLDHILRIAPKFDSKRLGKEKIFEVVFPNQDYNDVLLRRCMSRLLKLCEDYIVYNRVKSNPRQRQIELMTFYGEKKLERHFSGTLRAWKQKVQKNPVIDHAFFFNDFLVEKEISKHIFRQQDRTVEPNLQQISNSLDAFYLMHKLKICCTSLNYQTLSNTEYELPLLDELLVYFERNKSTQHPIVQAYYFALLCLKEGENEEHFQNLRTTLFENLSTFHIDEQMDLFSLAQNYCIKCINKGKQEYLKELLELYKIGLEKEIVIEEGFLSPLDYKNIVTLGSRLKQFDWTENFIETYTEKLEPSFRTSTYYYNLARLYFSKKEFEKIIALLHKVEDREIFVALDVKVMLLKTYYELEEIEPLLSLIESFRMFLTRKKNLGYHKTRYQNFIKFLRYLIRLNLKDASERTVFRTQVVETKELIEKDWFLEKVDE